MAKAIITNRQKQAIRTKNKVYNAAINLMQKQGIQQTTIEDICKKAKVSVGSFYNYFKSKDDVLLSIYESADQYFRDVVECEIEGFSGKEKIVAFFLHYARYNFNTGLDFTKHLYFNSENKLFLDRDRYMHVMLRNILEAAQGESSIDADLSVSDLGEFLFLVARGIVCDWCLNDGDYNLEEKTALHFRAIVDKL